MNYGTYTKHKIHFSVFLLSFKFRKFENKKRKKKRRKKQNNEPQNKYESWSLYKIQNKHFLLC